jgi:hypothetical protein
MDFKKMHRELAITNYFIFKYNLGFDDVYSLFLDWEEEDIYDLELPN